MANFKSSLFNFGRSAIGRALAISLALHAVLLLQTQPAGSNGGLQRRVTPAGNSVEASLRGMMGSPAVTPALPANPHGPTAPTPQGSSAQRALQSTHRSFPVQPPGTSEAVEIGIADENLAGTGATRAPAGSAVAAAALDEEGLDANGLRQYRLSLALESRRFKRYPQDAVERGWSGTAQVRIAIAASGVAGSVQLVGSSGYAALDAVALDMVGKAALNAVLPPSLRGRSFSVPLPVEFKLNSE